MAWRALIRVSLQNLFNQQNMKLMICNRIQNKKQTKYFIGHKERRKPWYDIQQYYLHMQNQAQRGQQPLCTLGNLLQIL